MEKIRKLQIYSTLNKNILIPLFGKKKLLEYLFKIKTHKELNLNHPVTYREKVQLRKLDEDNQLFIKCADKYRVREYVKEKIGEEYLIPLYFAKKKISIQDLKDLPDSFVLKTNNASRTNILVFEKNKEDLNKIVKKMNSYIKIKYGYAMLELFYNKIPPMIIAEKLLIDKGEIPLDYKIHCFKNKKDFKIFIQVDYERFSHHGRNTYDENWNLQPFTMGIRTDERIIKKPDNLNEMLNITKQLASDFEYVRVDLYDVNNKLYFGELTFTHGGGYSKFTPEEYDKIWGNYWTERKCK